MGDHINRVKLDNRRSNLRIVSAAGNSQNIPSCRGATSSYRGVSWNTKRRKWVAHVTAYQVQHYLGAFDTEEEAAEVARTARASLMPYATD